VFVSFLLFISEIRECSSLGRLWTWCCVAGSWDRQLHVSVTFVTYLARVVKVLWKSYKRRSRLLLLNWAKGGFPRKNTMSSLLFMQLFCFWSTTNNHSKQILIVSWNNQKSWKAQFTPLLCPYAIKSIKWYQRGVLILRLTPWEIRKKWVHHKEFWRDNLW